MNFFEKIFDNLHTKQWSIGIAKNSFNSIVDINLNELEFNWISIDQDSTLYADPFIYSYNGRQYIFFEKFCHYDYYGKIALIILNENFEVILQKDLLDTRSHLSYPFVFLDNERLYILPESSKEPEGNHYAYEFDFESNSLKNQRIVIAGQKLLDTTILKHHNKYWLFATKRGNKSESELFIYHSHQWDKNYQPHQLNPIQKSPRNCRPAGSIIVENEKIYRPTQNCESYYGKSVVLNQIILLNDSQFEEIPIKELKPPQNTRNNFAIHTINFSNDVIVIDGLRRIFNPIQQLKQYITRRFFRN